MNGLMNVVALGFERKALVFRLDTFARMVMSTCTFMDHFSLFHSKTYNVKSTFIGMLIKLTVER